MRFQTQSGHTTSILLSSPMALRDSKLSIGCTLTVRIVRTVGHSRTFFYECFMNTVNLDILFCSHSVFHLLHRREVCDFGCSHSLVKSQLTVTDQFFLLLFSHFFWITGNVSCIDQLFHFIRIQYFIRSHGYYLCVVCICFFDSRTGSR